MTVREYSEEDAVAPGILPGYGPPSDDCHLSKTIFFAAKYSFRIV